MKLKKDLKKHKCRFGDYDILDAFKMMGNRYRMNILLVLDDNSNLTLDQINGLVGGEFKNIHVHAKKLHLYGLINKKYVGVSVQHTISEYGKVAVFCYNKFLKDPYNN